MTETEKLIQAVEARFDARHTPFVIAVDGHSAAGKSFFARALVAARPGSALIALDDFYRVMDPDERIALDAESGAVSYYDWERLKAQALGPLKASQSAIFRRYDWDANALGDWQTIPASPLVVVEGCYSARPELASLIDLTVFVEADDAARRERQLARADAPADWLDRWDAAESHYIAATDLPGRADIVVTGTP